MLKIDEDKSGLTFDIYVQPRSGLNRIVGLYAEALKVKIKAPPVEGAANKMCIAVLAKALNLPKSALEIVSGHTARTKRVLVRFPVAGSGPPSEIHRLKEVIRSLCET